MAVSVALNNVLVKYIADGITIKWPNDIYYLQQKLGGVLIENTIVGNAIKTAVVGIGINVNQLNFGPSLNGRATSLSQILQQDVNLELLLTEICSQIECLYLRLKAGDYTFLRTAYVNKLYQLNKPAMYRQSNTVFEGTIKGIADSGLLNIEKDGELVQFNFKEIEFLNNK
jgi:BirA family biotin operon repressor/biotin-[acetyl-CoA-carboxylase] ligase